MENYNMSPYQQPPPQVWLPLPQLPAGGYETRILGVEYGPEYQSLIFYLDIDAGPWTGWFGARFKELRKTDPNVKWTGILVVQLPAGDGTEMDIKAQKILKAFEINVQLSNPGLDIAAARQNLNLFIGCRIGVFVRDIRFLTDAGEQTYPEAFWPASIEKIQSGTFVTPKPRVDTSCRDTGRKGGVAAREF